MSSRTCRTNVWKAHFRSPKVEGGFWNSDHFHLTGVGYWLLVNYILFGNCEHKLTLTRSVSFKSNSRCPILYIGGENVRKRLEGSDKSQ